MIGPDGGGFLGAFLRHPRGVGAIAPSSAALAHAMVRNLRVEPEHAILEFGPGTGALTAAIRDMLDDRSSYLGIEVESSFVSRLRARFPDLDFVEGSAADAARITSERGAGPVKAIISGLPFATLPAGVQDGIVRSLDAILDRGAVFRTYQYVHAYVLPKAVRFRRRMGELFGTHERSPLVLRNLPPAWALSWTR